jgi:hypothetical protein
MSIPNSKVFVTNQFFSKTITEITPKQRYFLRHNTKPVSYYRPNKVDQFRNIILKSVFLIIAKVTTN